MLMEIQKEEGQMPGGSAWQMLGIGCGGNNTPALSPDLVLESVISLAGGLGRRATGAFRRDLHPPHPFNHRQLPDTFL